MDKLFKCLQLFFLLLVFSSDTYAATNSRISYNFSGGRLGDNLLVYIHALYLSHIYKTPLLYKSFQYSSFLKLHDYHEKYSENGFSRIITLNNNNIDNVLYYLSTKKPILVILPFGVNPRPNFRDLEFRELVKHLISPKEELDLITPQHEQVNVAIHIREGGDVDPKGWQFIHPMKGPGLQFYADCIRKIKQIYPDQKLFFQIFTDAKNPKKIVSLLKTYISDLSNSSFNFHFEKHSDDLSVLRDLFSLMNFDVLIRPNSSFSIVAEMLHEFSVVCSPLSFLIRDNEIVIDQIYTQINYLKIL